MDAFPLTRQIQCSDLEVDNVWAQICRFALEYSYDADLAAT